MLGFTVLRCTIYGSVSGHCASLQRIVGSARWQDGVTKYHANRKGTERTERIVRHGQPISKIVLGRLDLETPTSIDIWCIVMIAIIRTISRNNINAQLDGRLLDRSKLHGPIFVLCGPKYALLWKNFKGDIAVCNAVYRSTISCCNLKTFAMNSKNCAFEVGSTISGEGL